VGAPRSILAVDDGDEFRHALVDALRFEGLRVESVRNGEEALAWLESHATEDWTIVLDLMMPVMDGKTFLARCAADARLAAIPVVVLTAGGDCRELRQTYPSVQCLSKTTALAELLAALQAAAR